MAGTLSRHSFQKISMLFSTPRGWSIFARPTLHENNVSDALAGLPWDVADLLSLPDFSVSPEPQLPGRELHDLGVVDEQVHVRPERFQVPLENQRIGCLEHPCLVAEPIHELLYHIFPPLRCRKILCNPLGFEHQDLRAHIKVSLRLLCHVLESPHLSLVAYNVGPASRSYHHGNLGLCFHA